MNIEQMVVIQCPFCSQTFEVMVDCSIDHQEYVEDCEVCCKPVTLIITVTEDGVPHVETHGEDS